MKKIFSVLLACLLAVCFAVSAVAAPEQYIFDRAGVLDDIDTLESRAAEIYDTYDVAIAVVIVEDDEDCSEAALNVWDTEMQTVDGAVLGINVDAQEFILGVFGSMSQITDEDYQALCKAYVEPDTYDEGVLEFMNGVERWLEIDQIPGEAPAQTETPTTEPADVPAQQGTYRQVVDEANVLTADQLDRLNAHAEDIGKNYPYDVVIYFAETLHQRDAQALADDFFDYNGYGVGSDRSGILLMICPTERKYAFSTRGDGYYMFDGRRFDDLEDSTLDDMKSGDWYQAAEDFLSVCEKYFQIGMPEEEPEEELNLPYIIVFHLIMAFFFSAIPVGSMKRKLRSVAAKREAFEYIADGLRLTRSEDHFVNMTVTRVPIRTESSSSSDGGRGTHTSSSGATHGGRSGSF